jgi:hypothetical protein
MHKTINDLHCLFIENELDFSTFKLIYGNQPFTNYVCIHDVIKGQFQRLIKI